MRTERSPHDRLWSARSLPGALQVRLPRWLVCVPGMPLVQCLSVQASAGRRLPGLSEQWVRGRDCHPLNCRRPLVRQLPRWGGATSGAPALHRAHVLNIGWVACSWRKREIGRVAASQLVTASRSLTARSLCTSQVASSATHGPER